VDLVALLTVAHLEIADLLPRVFGDVLVPQAVVDEILQMEMAPDSARPRKTMSKVDSGYRMEEITRETEARQKEFLGRVRRVVSDCCQIVSVPSLAEAAYRTAENLLGRHALAAVLAAKEYEAVLYSDDLLLRDYGVSQGVAGVWTQPVLRAAMSCDENLETRCRAGVAKLSAAQYWFVSVEPTDALAALRAGSWSVGPEVRSLLASLAGPDCEEGTAISVAAKILKLVWLHAPLVQHRGLVLDLVFASLVKGRFPPRAAALLKAAVMAEFGLHFLGAVEIGRNIDLSLRLMRAPGRIVS